jgi:DNA polymerase-3 subunit epsilon
MLDWLKNITKEHPEFWKEYSSKFEKKSNRYVILSTEKTGLNPDKDVILSFGCFGIVHDNLLIGDNFEVVILQYKFLHENGLSNEFIVESKLNKLGEPEAIQSFLKYIGNATLVGYRIETDVEIINTCLLYTSDAADD